MDVGIVLATSQPSGVSYQRKAQLKANAVCSLSSSTQHACGLYISAVVLRCIKVGEVSQCSFFLWEVHEADARATILRRVVPRPTAPSSTSSKRGIVIHVPNIMLYLPTPSKLVSTGILPGCVRWLPTQEESPTRCRGMDAVTLLGPMKGEVGGDYGMPLSCVSLYALLVTACDSNCPRGST